MSDEVTLGWIRDGKGKALAYFTKTKLFSALKGKDPGGGKLVGTYKDGKLYDLYGDFICAVSSEGA
jgi:hypothetical protein